MYGCKDSAEMKIYADIARKLVPRDIVSYDSGSEYVVLKVIDHKDDWKIEIKVMSIGLSSMRGVDHFHPEECKPTGKKMNWFKFWLLK